MIPIKDRRIVLIGGGGFIGHNLALRLKAIGAEVSIIDSLQINNLLAFNSADTHPEKNKDLYIHMLNQRLEMLRAAKVAMYIQDARDYHSITKLLKMLSPEVVVQLAAVAHANKSNKDPYSTFDHSFRTLENALDCSRKYSAHFIYFSSSMVYGHFEGGFVTEETPCEPLGIYGAVKYGGEKLVIAYNQVFDLPYTIVRPSALYGERCVSRRVGQIFIENAMQNTEITINGDGSDKLDFTYIQDLVDGIIKIIENEGSYNQIFNLTYGKSRSLADIADIIREDFSGVNISYRPKDRLVPDRGTLSVEKAKKIIGYEPSWPLEKGFRQYISWYKTLAKQTGAEGKVGLIFG